MKVFNFKEKYLLLRMYNKDPEAFTQVYDYFVERIYRFVFFKVKSQEDAQDITSEVFLKAWQYIYDGGKEIKNLNALLYRIARNLVIDYYRKASQKDVALMDENDTLNTQQKLLFKQGILSDSLENDLDHKLRIGQIEEKLQTLKEEYREVIILRYIEGLDIPEIAEIVGKKKGNIRVILYRAINILKELMSDSKDKS